MVHEWITAAATLRYLSDQPYTYNEQRAIFERAHSGLIAAKAETLVWNGEEQPRCKIPKQFWCAEEQALVQNWEAGDFSTCIDHKIEVKAFGVSFDFPAITELLPAERRAAAMQRISVSGNPEWIRADELTRLIFARTASLLAGDMIVEACALGQLVGRAMRVTGHVEGPYSDSKSHEWAAIEWDVPLWFWRDFLKPTSAPSWSLSKVKGSGVRNRLSEFIELRGVHFHRSGLVAMGLIDPEPEDGPNSASNRGRSAKYDWPAACVAIYGKIERGDLKPDVQADIEKALQSYLKKGDKEPSESTVRPYAKLIWDESRKP